MTRRTHLAFLLSGLLPRTYVSSTALWSDLVFKCHRIFLTLFWSHGLQVLGPISVLVKCAPRAYSEFIRSDIPGLSGARPAKLPFLRPSPLSVMRPLLPPISKPSSFSVLEPSIAKSTRGELRARLEVLAKKKRSVKRKPQASPEGCSPAQGKALKTGASSSPSSVFGARGSLGGTEPPLEVLPILVWSPI